MKIAATETKFVTLQPRISGCGAATAFRGGITIWIRRHISGIFLSLATAVLLVLSFPRHDYSVLAWVALVPLLLAIDGKGLLESFFLSLLAGMVFFYGVGRYILMVPRVTPFEYVFLDIYLGLLIGFFGVFLNYLHGKIPISRTAYAPLLWVSLEFLRSNAGFMSTPWALLGHSQHRNLPVIQIAQFTGVYGVTFLIVMVNAAISEVASFAINRYGGGNGPPMKVLWKSVLIAFPVLAIVIVYGQFVLSKPLQGESVFVTVVQGNHPLDFKWIPKNRKIVLDSYVELTREAAQAKRASLVAWPEVAIPASLSYDAFSRKAISGLARELGTFLLVGAAHGRKSGDKSSKNPVSYNSAFLFSPEGAIVRTYHKIRLVPFGEYVPFGMGFPWPSRYIRSGGINIPGKEYTVFRSDKADFGVVICWESLFPDLVRQFVSRGAQFMINITNEGWFRDTTALYQLAAINVFRAVENRVSVVRCANTGISCFINPNGEIERTLAKDGREVLIDGYLTHLVHLKENPTFYTKHGDLFAFISSGLTVLLFGFACSQSARNKRGREDSSP